MALVEGEYGTVGTEEHKVGFPMAWGSTILGRVRTFCEGASKADERSGTGGFRLPVTWPWGGSVARSSSSCERSVRR